MTFYKIIIIYLTISICYSLYFFSINTYSANETKHGIDATESYFQDQNIEYKKNHAKNHEIQITRFKTFLDCFEGSKDEWFTKLILDTLILLFCLIYKKFGNAKNLI